MRMFFFLLSIEKCVYKSTHTHTHIHTAHSNKRCALCTSYLSVCSTIREFMRALRPCHSIPDRNTSFRTLCYKITTRAIHISRPSYLSLHDSLLSLIIPSKVNHFLFASVVRKHTERHFRLL